MSNTKEWLEPLIFLSGIGQLCILIASMQVPFQLKWRTELAVLSRLHRQMYWIYGAYVVLAIVAFGLFSLFYASELANGSGLAMKMLDSGDVSDHPYQTQFEAFFNALDKGKEMALTNFAEAARSHEVIFAADRSAAMRRPVKLTG